MSKALLIASYYRSGTSALSGTLNLAGVDMVRSAEQNEHNPRGYFENPALIKLDIKILERLSRHWSDVRLMPEEWSQRPDAAADTQAIVRELKQHHADSPVWAVKHPHLCRLLPIYEDAARRVSGTDPGIIQIYRDPWVVAHSQQKKNNLSRSHALLLWVSHVLDAERYSRHLDRVMLDYELLVKDSAQAMRRISHELGFAFPNRSPQDLRKIAQFITPSLRRSSPLERETTPSMLRGLVQDVWDAALERAAPEVFDALRGRLDEYCTLIEELGASGLPVTPHVGGPRDAQTPPANEASREHTDGSTLRPSERTDIAERERLEADAARRPELPTIGVVVAVPAGRVEAAFETEQSLANQWRSATEIRYVTVDPDAPTRAGWHAVDAESESLLAAVGWHLLDLPCDYVAVIDAGDTIEPDACLRLGLYANAANLPTLIYTDEIVGNDRDPWVRYKPDFDIERLRGLHYIGSWVWIERAFIQASGTLDAAMPGAEDLDLVLRAYDDGRAIRRLPEALYTRAPHSLREPVATDILRQNVRTALDAHLARQDQVGQIEWHDGAIPGSMVPRHQPVDQPLSMILLCDNSDDQHASDLVAERLSGLLSALPIEHLVCAGTTTGMAPAIRDAVDTLSGTDSLPPNFHVVVTDDETGMLANIAGIVGNESVVFLALDANTEDPTWLGHMQAKVAAPGSDIGLVGARADYPDDAAEWRMAGPLLAGASGGVGIVGLGHTAGDPGPGGWLLGPQQADGVAPPCLAIRGELFRGLDFDTELSGAALWLDLSRQVARQGYRVVWDGSVSVQCPTVPAYAQPNDSNRQSRLRQWLAVGGSDYHHPALALQGELLSTTASGLVPPVPRTAPYALLSGSIEGAELAVEWLRATRMSGQTLAGWAPEPITAGELRRLAPEAWLRINPESEIPEDDAPGWRALYSRPPRDYAPLKAIAAQAERVYATSPVLGDILRKQSYNRIQPELVLPRLSSRLWAEVADLEIRGRSAIRVLWVDEGEPPDWITELMTQMQNVSWFVVQSGERTYNGPIATRAAPTDEVGWRDLFVEAAPHLVIRPAGEATWMDCQLLLRGAAVGAALVADERLHWIEALPVESVGTRFKDWKRTLDRLTGDTEALLETGRQARKALEQIGWLEDVSPETFLLDDASSSSEGAYRKIG
ncbi:hypothetical protein ACS8Y6_06030 [Salinisphaera sp. RV14]|uniref:hypothetical protein n=1 Tax=unclassified Salinisphaera TaxID=2649847 RepID=UPI003F838016